MTQRGEWLGSCDEVAVVEPLLLVPPQGLRARLAGGGTAALLLYGDESPVVTPDDARRLHEVNPRAGVVAVAHAGHMIPWDNPGQTAGEIEAFLSKLKKKGP